MVLYQTSVLNNYLNRQGEVIVKKTEALKQQITQTDKEIDTMVYELHGLTKEELKIKK